MSPATAGQLGMAAVWLTFAAGAVLVLAQLVRGVRSWLAAEQAEDAAREQEGAGWADDVDELL